MKSTAPLYEHNNDEQFNEETLTYTNERHLRLIVEAFEESQWKKKKSAQNCFDIVVEYK